VAALRRAAQERGGPLPSIDVADALLDERVALVAQADQQHAWVLGGDDRGIYGDYRPDEI
jgi:hypothetical protein